MAKVHKAPTLLAIRIRQERIRNGLSQAALGQMVGVGQSRISDWERGTGPDARTKDAFEQMIKLLEIDSTPIVGEPTKEAPVPVTKSLRVALSTPEDEFAYSPRKIQHSLDYLVENLPRLLDRLERSAREIQHLEQTQGITQEQLAILRDKARKFDQMEELMGRKLK